VDDLDAWLAESYPTAYRTACLVLRSPADAEDAVQDAFLRVWRVRDAIPGGDGRRAGPRTTPSRACRIKPIRNTTRRTPRLRVA
jgi:hypothetical protein